jgi:hypothetical protein
LDFDVNPFGLLGAISKTLELHLEHGEESDETKVHWSSELH